MMTFLVWLAVVAATAPRPPEPVSRKAPECTKPSGFSVSSGLALAGCTPLDPLTVDINEVKKAMRGCTMPGGRRVEQVIRSEDLTNHGIRILDGDKTIAEFTPKPSAKLTGGGGGVAGPYLLVEFRTGKVGARQLVYHRSGVRVGVAGPWDGRTFKAGDNGWTIASGGGLDMRYFVPHASETLTVKDRSVDNILRHAFVWLTPRPSSRQFGIDCLARPVDELKYWLGDDYEKAAAEKARALMLQMGASWLEGVKDGPAVAEVLKAMNPPSPEWQRSLWKAFQDDGLDVQLAKELRSEHARDALKP